MRRKHQRTLELIFAHPTSANVQWKDIEALFAELGAERSVNEKVAGWPSSCSTKYGFFIGRILLPTPTRERLQASANGLNSTE